MNSFPYFSVVISLYNKEKYISDTLKSVLDQTLKDFEVIIVNDGSTDNGLNIVQTFNDERIKIINQENQGVSVARNNGVKKAKGNFIVFLDADDLLRKNHLETLYNLKSDFNDAKIFCTSYCIKYSESSLKIAKFYGLDHNYRGYIYNYFKNSFLNEILRLGNSSIDKNIFKDNDVLFDTDMKSIQDTDLWVRLGLKYKMVIDTTSKTLIHLKEPNNLSEVFESNERLLFFNKYKRHELSNKYLKKYMDLNRFSVAWHFKLQRQHSTYRYIIKSIDFNNLNYKQKTLLKTPTFLLKVLQSLKTKLNKMGLYFTIYE